MLVEDVTLFTPGPVPVARHLRAIAEGQPLYNRTREYSKITREILSGLQGIFQTQGSVALLTASGTGAMEAAVLNFLGASDHVLVINGGTFGQRWCDLCDVHSIAYTEYRLPYGADVDLSHLSKLLASHPITALLVNAHETSTGQLYDIEAIGALTRERGIFYIVDAISTICADLFCMDAWQIDVAVLSSHKALALPPGLSFVAMSTGALKRLERGSARRTLYFDLKNYLDNQERGQMPYTPAIGLMMQLHQRLLDIQEQSLPALVSSHKHRAEAFRNAIADLPFRVLPSRSSDAMTALSCIDFDATTLVEALKVRHGILVAPSGGALKSKLIRISHMGAQDARDLRVLVPALKALSADKTLTNGHKQ